MAGVDVGGSREREAKVWKKCAVLVLLVLMAREHYRAVQTPPQGICRCDGGGAWAAAFWFCNTVGFYVSLGMAWLLLRGFPLQPILALILLSWSAAYLVGLLTVTTDFLSLGLSLLVSLAVVAHLRGASEKDADQLV